MLVSRSVGVMPNPLDTREIFYSNLLLLGFDPVAMESREKIPFNRDMFVLPNKKAMEIVMYFLFSKLNPKITHEEFRGCWPVKNKVDEQKFRKTCYNWVSKLAKEESDTYFPRVVQSLFHSPGGDRFYNFLLLFTMYVLKVVMHRDHSKHVSIPTFPSKSIHNHSFSQVMSKSLQVQTSLHRKRFLDLTQYSLEVQQHWKSYSIELNKENRSLKNKKRDVEKRLQKEVSSKGEQMAKSIAMSNDYQKQVDALQRTQQLQKVRALWKGIEDFSSEHNPQVVDSILTNQANQHHLDATDVEVKIPDLLLREFERDIHMKRISNTYISGKLNLLSLMQLWNLSLTLMKEQIQQDSVPSFDESSPKIKNDIHTHQGLLSNVESLRSTVTKETIPDLKQSVEQLKSKIYQDMIQLDGTPFAPHHTSFNVGLGLLPATPPVSFSAAETPASQTITSFEESLKRTPAGVSTPDVINAWSESLKGRRPPAQKVQLSKPSRHINDRKTTRSQQVDQPTQIPKPKNIPTSIARNQHRVGKAREDKIHKTLPKKGMSSSARKQGPTARKNEVISPLALDPRSRLAQTELRKVVHKSDIKSDLGRESATANVANQIIGALSLDKPDSGSSSQSSRSSTPRLQAVDDPMKALDETAFVSHDILTRTPAPKNNYSALRTAVNDVQEFDKDSQSTSKSQHQSPHTNTGLFETILNQARQPPTAKTVRTVLFSSPEKQDYHQYDSNFRDDSPPKVRSSIEINSHRNQPLLSPFAFETPKVSKEDDKLKQDGITLLTPFSFVTPLTHTSSSIEGVENEFTPLRTQVSQERGPNTEHTGTPKVDTLINFTLAASRERGPNIELRGTPKIDTLIHIASHERGSNIESRGTPKLDTLIHFTPATSQTPGIGSLAKTHKGDGLDSSFNLSTTFEEKLTLSKETNNTRTPGLDILTSPFANTKTMSNGKSRFSNKFLGPQIDLLEPTVFNESLNLSDDGSGGENSEPKRSPFGAVDVSDDDGEGQDPLASSDAASQPTVSTTDGTRSFKEMKESDLMNRLKKIKEAQSYDFSYLSPGVSTSNDPDPLTVMSGDKEYTDRDVAMETMQANRLDQIQEAHSSQQVKPGADIQVNLELYRGTDEVALMTPLTISSKDSPDNLTKALEENVKSNISTPTSMLSERFLQESPGKENNSNLFFSLDSPDSPDTDPIKIISTNGLSPPEGAPSRRTPEKGLVGRGATPLGAQIGPSSSVHLWNTGPSPITTSLKNDDKIFWLTSNGMTSKGLPSDRRLSYDDFLNESVDTSFLVPGTPYKLTQGSHGAPRTPVDDDHAYKPPDNSVAIATTTSPAVAQLIEF